MKSNSIPRADRVLCGVALVICMFLADFSLVFLAIQLTEATLVFFGVSLLHSAQTAIETPIVTVPLVLLANAGFILALRRKAGGRQTSPDSPNLNNTAIHPASGIVAIG